MTYTVEERRVTPLVAARWTVKGWNVARLDKTALRKVLQTAPPPAIWRSVTAESVEALIGWNMYLIASWCDISMPRKAVSPFQRPAYWWTFEIGEVRAECCRQRRTVTRSHHRIVEVEELYKIAPIARKNQARAIRESKRRCTSELREDINRDPCGRGYQIATKRFGNNYPVASMNPATMRNIVDSLFPDHPEEPPPRLLEQNYAWPRRD